MKRILLFLFLLFPKATWAAFTYYSPIVLLSSQVPNTDQANFPALISQLDNRLKVTGSGGHVADSNGFDIRPYSDTSCTTALTYQLQRYVSTTGELLMRVLITSLSHTVDTTIYLCYGDAALNTDGSSTSTWNSAYKAVFNTEQSASPATDITSNPNDGAQSGGVTFLATGKVGKGVSFAAASNQVLNAGSDSSVDDPAAMTITAWINPTTLSSSEDRAIIGKKNSGATDGWWVLRICCGDGTIEFIKNGSTQLDTVVSNSFTTGSLQWFVMTWDGSNISTNVKIYRNNSVLTHSSDANGISLGVDAANSLRIGDIGDSTESFDGVIDEITFSNVVRSTDWLTTQYNNESSPGTFETLNTEVSIGGSSIKVGSLTTMGVGK